MSYQGAHSGAEVDDAVGAGKGTGNGVMVKSGTGAGVRRTITGSTRVDVTNGDGVSGNPTLDLTQAVIDSLARADVSVMYVDTLADLQALPTSGLVDGQVFDVKGGKFKWNGTAFIPLGRIPVTAWAVGDGITDDKQAITDAIQSGYKLDWQDKTYSVSGQIGSLSTTIATLDWVSDGAVVSMDGTAHVEAVFMYEASSNLHAVLKGNGLTFNGNDLANTGFYLRQSTNDRIVTVKMEGLSAKNLRRDPSFTTSDGLRFSGGFYNIELKKPRVETIKLPAGAGTLGVVGVHGITLSRSGLAYPENSRISDPYVKDIYSEDSTYPNDQDGMRLFSATDDANRGEVQHIVERGYFENCWGRDIKIQAHAAHISGVRLKHTTGPSVGMDHPVIDFQSGGGTVSGLNAEFDGPLPPAVVNFGSSAAGVEVPSSLKDSFVHIISGEIPAVLRAFTPNPSSGNGQIKADNVRIKGAVTNPVMVLTPDDAASATLVNVQCDNITDALAAVKAQGGTGPYLCDFTFIKCINTGPVKPICRSNIVGSAANSVISQFDCIGFSDGPGRANPNESVKSRIQRTGDMIGQYDTGGVLRLDAVTLADGANHVFPAIGYSTGVQMAMVSMNRTATEQALVAYDSGGADALAVGANVQVGGTSSPGSGMLRIWVDSATGGLTVSNNSGGNRTITVMFFG